MPNSKGLPSWFPDDFAADDELILALEGVEDYGSEEGGSIATQLGLTEADGLLGQLIELARTPSWVNEKRNARGEWTKGGGSLTVARAAVSATGRPSAGMQRQAIRRAQENRRNAQAAVAERLAEEHARNALEQATAEMNRVRQELESEARTAENAKHRTKLAVHAVLVIGGAILAAIMAHFDVSPVLAAFAGAGPLLSIELTDWKKHL